MKEQHKSSKPSENPQNQFRTSRRPSPPGPSTAHSKGTTAKRELSPESSALSRAHKRTILPDLRAQPTLTQIDFVTQATASDDDQLDYIDEHCENAIEQPQRGKESDNDVDFLPPQSARSARMTKFQIKKREHDISERPQERRTSAMSIRNTEQRHVPRRSATPRVSAGRKGARKSLEKSTGKRDKTLTQMDFVRRYITIDDDDDVNLGYIQPSSEKKPIVNKQEVTPAGEKNPQASRLLHSAKRNRRVFEEELDLSTGEPISQPKDAQDSNFGTDNVGDRVSAAPMTPQKPRRREIPSSQSPESPGLVMITSSQFRGATHSSSTQEPLAPSQPIQPIKEESPEPRRVNENSQDRRDGSVTTTTNLSNTQNPSNMHISQPAEHYPSPAPPTDSSSEYQLSEANEDSKNGARKKERTVIYETDADTDYGESDDEDSNRDSLTPSPKKTPRAIGLQMSQNVPESPKDDSQVLPLPDVPCSSGLEHHPSDDALPSEPPMSDASAYYHRMHAATQFPHEPIPTLNTQKLAELFPQEDSTQSSKLEPCKPSSQTPRPGPFYQIQTQSQGDKESTEMVPESSPTRERESQTDAGETPFQRPRAPDSLVQVESSQAIDHNWPGRVLSRSQLLTSSVMESVPLPSFWMGSQDSVGEPYSLPEG
ncbi:hypothetical protein PENANT_c016G03259 [Penicillium antarcticum]|uniref:Uncharacterized protein n=1 Tax=Penicillium antarcticum TaxID=416450 RepID=A0A1V6Q2X7_9EURO|nr:uncharacterized protein N7508_001293 [Penicillium antarcticum]KAJ5316785.1 hypothetical protein N7508_001293 [Penicillium antarcticum]OQD83584.1 hypothetical protein PENANT_c016G03259 [Penicillium antarcticum]